MTTVVVEGGEAEAPALEEALVAAAAESTAEVAEAQAEAVVAVAEIEAAEAVAIAEINAEVAVEAIEATSEDKYQECQTAISALTMTVQELAEKVALLTPVQSEQRQTPQPEPESLEPTQENQEAPVVAPRRKPRLRLI
jgi:hypothetical protein